MTLYHASNVLVDKPEIRESNRTLDFGIGFYTTSNKKQAGNYVKRVVERNGGPKIINTYSFDKFKAFSELKILTFQAPDKAWFDFVCDNRKDAYKGPEYDIIYGPVANDKVYNVVNLFSDGLLTYEAAIAAIKPFRLYNQYVFKTAKSLLYIKFESAKEEKQ